MSRRVADIGFIAGGALLLLSALLYWVRRGAGSTLRGHDLIDTVQSLAHGGSSAATTVLTILWYAVPACGALAWVVVGFGDPHGRSGRATAALALTVTIVIDTYFFVKVGSRAGAGAYVAAAGALTLATSSVVPQKSRIVDPDGTT